MDNGNGLSRLDRIENAIETVVRSQAHLLEAQTQTEREVKNLLTSQGLLQDELRTLAANTDKSLSSLATKIGAIDTAHKERMTRIEIKLEGATDKINALVVFMDQHLREHRDGKA